MQEPNLLDVFIEFGLAALLGFLIGLEREMTADEEQRPAGQREFVLFALFGAGRAFAAERALRTPGPEVRERPR